MNPLIRPWKQLFNFRGRATRTEYLLFHLTFILGVIGIELLFFAMGAGLGLFHAGRTTQPNTALVVVASIMSIFWVVFFVAFVIGHFSVAVRRLHDHGEPGLRYLLTFIPLIGLIFWAMMVFTRGDDFENEYGPDPRLGDAVSPDQLGGVFS